MNAKEAKQLQEKQDIKRAAEERKRELEEAQLDRQARATARKEAKREFETNFDSKLEKAIADNEKYVYYSRSYGPHSRDFFISELGSLLQRKGFIVKYDGYTEMSDDYPTGHGSSTIRVYWDKSDE